MTWPSGCQQKCSLDGNRKLRLVALKEITELLSLRISLSLWNRPVQFGETPPPQSYLVI